MEKIICKYQVSAVGDMLFYTCEDKQWSLLCGNVIFADDVHIIHYNENGCASEVKHIISQSAHKKIKRRRKTPKGDVIDME